MEYDLIKDEELDKETEYIDQVMSTEGLIVLCKNSYSRQIIDEKYSLAPEIYYEYYLKVEEDYYLALRKNMLDIEEEAAYSKLMGIWLYEELNDVVPRFTKELLFKAYKGLYREIKNSYSCDISEILEKRVKRNGGKKLKKEEVFELALVALQIAAAEKKPLDISSFSLIKELCSYSTEALDLSRGEYLKFNKKNRLYDYFPTECLNIKKFNNISDVVSYISTDYMNEPIMSDSMMYFDNFLNSIGLDTFSMTNVPYTEEDVKIMTHFLNYDSKYILSDDSKKTIISALYIILGMKKKYYDAKSFMLKKNMDKEYHNLLSLKIEYKEKEDSYKEQIEKLQRELNNKNNQISDLKANLLSLENKNKKLSQNISSIEDNTKEVVSLREAIYSMESEDYVESNISMIEKIALINNSKVTVIGGTDSWVKNLKEVLNDVKFIKDESKNIDISFIKNMDFLFINVKNLSHSFYYKIINVVRKCDITLFYVNESNKEIVINRMFNLISNNLK